MNRISQILAFVLLSIAGGATASANDDEQRFPQSDSTEFARVVHGSDGEPEALQVAIARYRSAADGETLTVDLIGAVHVGDRGYYAELNQRFKDYDAVLFELIAPPGVEQAIGSAERRGFVSGAQLSLTKALGLSFQLDEVDYGASNLVHADLSPEELALSMKERDESLYVYFWRMVYASVREAQSDPLGLRAMRNLGAALEADIDNPLKVAFAYEMTNVRDLGTALDGADGSALIAARNERAVDVLEERIRTGDRKLAIFYGVAHMPDFEDRLVDNLRLRYSETRWVTAWWLRQETPFDKRAGQ